MYKQVISLEDLKEAQENLERWVIENSDVIVCTCATSGDARLVGVKAQVVLLDESSQALEPE